MIGYYLAIFTVVAIPTWFIWFILKDSNLVHFLAHQTLQKVFRYSSDGGRVTDVTALKILRALFIFFEHVVPLTLGLTLGIYTYFAVRGDYEYIDAEALFPTLFLTYGALIVFHYGIRLIIGSIERIIGRFRKDGYYRIPLGRALAFFMEWIAPVTLSLALGVWWYLVQIDIIIL